jgi:hypothetical protein
MILAQQSAFGLLPENKTGLTGIYYQKFIRWGIVLAKILFTKKPIRFAFVVKQTSKHLK